MIVINLALRWESVEMTRSLHMGQREFPDVDLILSGDPAEYLKNVAGSHRLEGERPLKMNATLQLIFSVYQNSCKFGWPHHAPSAERRVLGHEGTEQPTE